MYHRIRALQNIANKLYEYKAIPKTVDKLL